MGVLRALQTKDSYTRSYFFKTQNYFSTLKGVSIKNSATAQHYYYYYYLTYYYYYYLRSFNTVALSVALVLRVALLIGVSGFNLVRGRVRFQGYIHASKEPATDPSVRLPGTMDANQQLLDPLFFPWRAFQQLAADNTVGHKDQSIIDLFDSMRFQVLAVLVTETF